MKVHVTAVTLGISSRGAQVGCAFEMHREETDTYRVFVEKPERKRLLGRPSVDGSIILKLILKKYVDTLWIGLIWVGKVISGELL